MSCCVCRLPFLPKRKQSTNPLMAHFAPPGVLTENQTVYFEHLVSFGEMVSGFMLDCVYFSGNMLGAARLPAVPIVLVMQWEQVERDSVLITMHKVCYDLFRRSVCPGEDTRENLRKLAAIEHVMGRPLGAENTGRWADIDYEGVGEKVDLRPLWRPGTGLGENVFHWKGLDRLGYDWLVNRPDIFPRFHREVNPSRLVNLANASPGEDILTRQPQDVLRCIAGHLPDGASLARFAATCRFMRFLSLTEWQPVARALIVRTLPWAMPTPAETKASTVALAGPSEPGDWMLYLSHVHRTKSMRVRRWIWAVCEDIQRVAHAKLEAARALEEGSEEWAAIETKFNRQWPMYQAFWHPEVIAQDPNGMKMGQEMLARMFGQMRTG
ncbi:hypothetical protein AURDEDRAFT_103717 [Auricularia subglabra TFB-10046 SS5]|nr:hypothetical protein AURDEDRAFT_103717 [Auricularia subglabra TFB-10046 SS5]